MKTVKDNMQGLVSEAYPDFEKVADAATIAAVKRARKTQNLTEEEALKKVGAKPEIRARYKIEVMFNEGRTTAGPNLLGISIWESGKRFHGGGDELMYWCMDTESKQGCKSAIPGDLMKGPFAICPNCKQAISLERATSLRVLKVTTKVLADELVKLFHSLGGNADLYLKYHKTDIRYIAMERAKGPEVAHRLKGMHIYPLKNILKDTSNGAELSGRFHAFLTS